LQTFLGFSSPRGIPSSPVQTMGIAEAGVKRPSSPFKRKRAGGGGSDTFNAGAGSDVLLIDALDLQANIHGGDGIDVVLVVGDGGVTLNLTQTEVEVVRGGRGNGIANVNSVTKSSRNRSSMATYGAYRPKPCDVSGFTACTRSRAVRDRGGKLTIRAG